MATVAFKDITKSFGSVKVIHGIALKIKDGEFVALVGPSGCGKTTLLRMVAGLEDPTSGTIEINDQIVNDKLPKDRDIAMVFQSYALYPHMNVFENMAFSLRLQKEPEETIARKVGEASKILNLTEYLDRKPKALSGGQRQRVAMGRAIVRNPSVFLFDEPLSNLDAKLRTDMRKEVKLLHQRLNTTSIYVTHDQTEAMTMADRIVVMNNGRIEQMGTPLELYKEPTNQFVAGFIGAPQMNFLSGTVKLKGKKCFLAHSYGDLPIPSFSGADEEQKITIGIRPEDIIQDPKSQMEARIEVCEPMGKETHLTCRLGDDEVRMITESDINPNISDKIGLSYEIDSLHIFDCDSGARLLNH